MIRAKHQAAFTFRIIGRTSPLFQPKGKKKNGLRPALTVASAEFRSNPLQTMNESLVPKGVR
jgi:hypothetical protein